MRRDSAAQRLIAQLGLSPHPEGGWYAETWRRPSGGGRGAGSAIYFLLRRGEVSRWHRVDATEIWHFYAGQPLQLQVAATSTPPRTVVLGPDVGAQQRPQAIVPAGAWQTAATLGEFTLVGATVSPAFELDGFELAPPGWQPPAP
ncbi:MAG: cupin domain-containing protein [Actinomycetota bacterium]|nr:cupin domain-containing protein [Actinomycetota bacterium]